MGVPTRKGVPLGFAMLGADGNIAGGNLPEAAAVADLGAITSAAPAAMTAVAPAAMTAVAAAGANPTKAEFDALLADVIAVRAEVVKLVTDLTATRAEVVKAVTDLGASRTKWNAELAALRASGLQAT